MKKLALLLLLVLALSLTSCVIVVGGGTKGTGSSTTNGGTTPTTAAETYTLSCDPHADYEFNIGDDISEIDFTAYFRIVSSKGNFVAVTSDMLDVSQADTSKVGTFTVTLTYDGQSVNALFTVSDNGGEQGGDDIPLPTYESVFTDKDLSVGAGAPQYTSSLSANSFDANRGVQFLQKSGEVTLTSKTSLTKVEKVILVLATNCETGMKVSVKVGGTAMLSGGETVALVSKGETFSATTTVVFTSDTLLEGAVTVTLTPTAGSKSMYISGISVNGTDGGNQGGDNTDNVMPPQIYDPAKLNNEGLQDKLLEADGYIGLPARGEYSCLVVPVQFAGDTISNSDLDKLDKAFNGSETDTGWESVSSYYYKSSYGKLCMSFDIQNVYATTKNADYYNQYSKEVDLGDGYTTTQTGAELLLLEVLAKLENQMDLTKYDYNNDGCIDGVYLIYSAPVEYEDDSSIYWAYVSYYVAGEEDNQTFDGLDAYYYLFAGFDFMDEDADTADGYEMSGIIDGLQINAGTYIHETAHMLGIDDYYDYFPDEGSDEGVGGADMMDCTVGDHNPYTKLMMGWVTPEFVTQTATYSISSFTEEGDFLLIPLDYNHSYFCEYLLIDFYTASWLNQLHASQDNSYLYDGAAYGVRIYHVVSWAEHPYDNDYGSFTDCNNSLSTTALIKLLEADGTKKFSDSDGYAMADDLWQTGDSLSAVFPNYKRADGAKLNFDIVIEHVGNDSSASITVVYN